MSNVLSEAHKQQVLALGRMGWSLRRIERDTGINRDTAARYLREAGIAVKKPGPPSKQTAKPAISPAEVTPDPTAPDSKPANMATPDPTRKTTLPQQLRALPRHHRRSSLARPQRQSHLAGHGRLS